MLLQLLDGCGSVTTPSLGSSPRLQHGVALFRIKSQ
jgi:hypothetical protein